MPKQNDGEVHDDCISVKSVVAEWAGDQLTFGVELPPHDARAMPMTNAVPSQEIRRVRAFVMAQVS